MAIDAVTIGPFKGGLNNVSQSGESADTELVELVNMSVTTDAALTSRPPMKVMGGLKSSLDAFDILGIYRETPNLWHLIVQERVATGWEVKAFAMGDSTRSAVVRAATGISDKVSAFVQVNNMGYFCAITGAVMNGFKWRPGTTFADIATMPKGHCMVSFKSRLWITSQQTAENNSRMWFSTIDSGGIKIETWNVATDYLDVAPGEGGYVTAIVALNSSLVIFKNDGAWRYSYSTSPAKGVVDKISGTIGAANKNVVVEFNNLVYTYDQGKLYELVNNNFSAINRKVEFREDSEAVHIALGTDLSAVGTNLILRYFNALYVYSGETATWSQWRSKVGVPGKFIELPADSNNSKPSVYIAGSRGTAKTGDPVPFTMIQLEGDNSSVLPVEDIECVIRTKSYDYKAPSVYKRLFWWGIDHKSNMTFTTLAIPVVKKRMPTWAEMKAFTWKEAEQGTWGNPLKWRANQVSVSDSFDVTNEQTENGRIFSKIRKSLLFRQISYEVRMHTQGNASTGPAKIFSLVTYVSAKHNVVDKNN